MYERIIHDVSSLKNLFNIPQSAYPLFSTINRLSRYKGTRFIYHNLATHFQWHFYDIMYFMRFRSDKQKQLPQCPCNRAQLLYQHLEETVKSDFLIVLFRITLKSRQEEILLYIKHGEEMSFVIKIRISLSTS